MEDGTAAPAGDYTIEVDARYSNGNKIYVQTKAQGMISGINFTPRGPQVLIGKDAIDLADIKSISDPSVGEKEDVPGVPLPGLAQSGAGAKSGLGHVSGILPSAQEATPVMPEVAQMPHKTEVKPETKPGGLKRAKLAQGSVMDANMPGSLMNKLKKEGYKEGA